MKIEHRFGADQLVNTNSSPSFNSVSFDLTPTGSVTEGNLRWNPDDGTLEVGLPGGNVALQIGQEQLLKVTNKTGSNISNGSVVYINGAQGQRPTIALADADTEPTSDRVIGVTTETINDNNSGYVCINGLVRGLDTSGYLDGDILYVSSTAGQFTNVEPVAPAHSVIVGSVVHSDLSAGVILVHVQTGFELDELHDVLISGLANKDVLEYDSVSGLWKNTPDIKNHLLSTSNPHSTSDANLLVSDITTNNASSLAHGFLPKLSGSATQYLNGQGNYVTIAGTGVPSGYSAVTFAGQTSVTVTHNFGVKPLVQVLDASGSPLVLVPLSISHTSDNAFTVTFSASQSGTILVSAGVLTPNITTTAISYTIINNDNIVVASASGITITLPTAVGITGKTYTIDNASSGSINITGTGGETVQGETVQSLSSGNSVEVYSTGSAWRLK